MMKFNICISDETINEIDSIYGNKHYDTVNTVLSDIIERYFNVEYFDPELEIVKNEDNEKCPICGEYSMNFKMFDIDGRNLEEYCVCSNCNYNMPNML